MQERCGSAEAGMNPETVLNSTRFVLVRHAQSTWNAVGRWQGHGDPPLSETGRAQAAGCAEEMAGLEANLLVCSDLRRTRETAAEIGRVLNLEPVACERLRELAVGEWTGLTREQIEQRDPELLAEFETDDPHIRPGGGETRAEIRLRVRREIESIAQANPGRCIVLVVHAGVIRALVPDADPGNAEVVEVTLADIRSGRQDIGAQIGVLF